MEKSMAIKHSGLEFIPNSDGGITIKVGHNSTENSEIIRDVVLTPEQWGKIVISTIPVGPAPSVDITPGPVATVNSAEAIKLVETTQTIAELDQLQSDEEGSQKHPGGRKGVLEAIMKRRDELTEQE